MGKDRGSKCCSGTNSRGNLKKHIIETNAINATPKISREGSQASARIIQQKLSQEIKKIQKIKPKKVSNTQYENLAKNSKNASTNQVAKSVHMKVNQQRKNSKESAQESIDLKLN